MNYVSLCIRGETLSRTQVCYGVLSITVCFGAFGFLPRTDLNEKKKKKGISDSRFPTRMLYPLGCCMWFFLGTL